MVPNICAPSGVEPLTTWSFTFCEGLHKPVDHGQYLYTKRVQCQAQLDILVHTIYVDVMIPNIPPFIPRQMDKWNESTSLQSNTLGFLSTTTRMIGRNGYQ